MPVTTPTALDAALHYAEQGWATFPIHSIRGGRCTCGRTRANGCDSPGKHPRTKSGFKDASTDSAQIEEWWTRWPSANVGIATGASGLVVIDIDPKNGGDYQDLVSRFGEAITDTVISNTGGGGTHLIYRSPSGVAIGNVSNSPNYIGPLGSGVDVRAVGGYILVYPSNHESGHTYEWEDGCDPDTRAPALLPEALADVLDPARAVQPARAPMPAVADILGGVPEGARDWTLFQLASKLRYADVPFDWASTLVLEAAARCQPPFPAATARAKVVSAYGRYEPTGGVFLLPEGAEDLDANLLIWANQLDTIPNIEWQVEDIVPVDSLAVLVGAFGSKKTFVMLDLSMSVATGRAWHGHEVVKGYVLYVFAEGVRGLRNRVRAWEEHHQSVASDIAFVPRAVKLLDNADIEYLLQRIAAEMPEKPSMIVIDTLARAMSGGDENDQKDMGLLIDGADRLRRATGATVWLVHHTNRRDEYRGSSVLPGAMDTMVVAEAKENTTILTCEKQKDGEPFAPITLGFLEVGSSLVPRAETQTVMKKRDAKVLAVLEEGDGLWFTSPELQAATGLGERSVGYAMEALVGLRKAEREGEKRWARYRIQTENAVSVTASAVAADRLSNRISGGPIRPPVRLETAVQKRQSRYDDDVDEDDL